MKRHIARVREDKSMAPPTTRPLENRALQLRSLLLQHLTRVMTRTLVAGQTSLPRLTPRQSLRQLRRYHLLTRRATTARAGSRDQDHRPGRRRRLSVITTSTRATANMVTDVHIAIPNTTGIRRRKRVGKARARAGRQDDQHTPSGKKNEHCYGWARGECKRGDTCKFKHDPKMKGKEAAPSTPKR